MSTRKYIILSSIIAFAIFIATTSGITSIDQERAKRAPLVQLDSGEQVALRTITITPISELEPALPEEIISETSPEMIAIEEVEKEEVGEKTIPPVPTCQKPKTLPQPNFFLEPVSPDNAIGLFVPERLIPLNDFINIKYKSICLESDAAYALHTMDTAAKTENVKLVVLSAFRSFEYQEKLKTEEVLEPGAKYPSIADAGHSEHQLGTAIDFTSGTNPAHTFHAFKYSPEYAWLVQHAADYGFIQSYQEGKEEITGYIAEPWHWRYVGPTIAELAQKSNKTLYEYLSD